MARNAARHGIIHLTADPEVVDGRTISPAGERLIHFGSCSYLGLELHERLRRG